MVNDYDLVIVGGTLVARQAAIAAATEGARVALVEPDPHRVLNVAQHQALIDLIHPIHQWQTSPTARFTAACHQPPINTQTLNWQGITDWVIQVSQAAIAAYDLEQLALAGVDIILEQAQFCADPKLHVTTQSRTLSARSFWLLTGFTPTPPAIAGLEQIAYSTPADVLTWPALPQHLAILGSTPTALELAQAFASLGVAVTLWLPPMDPRYDHDETLVQWVIAQLQASGVDIRSGACPQIPPASLSTPASPSPIQLQFEAETVSADRLIVATAPRLWLKDLGLEKLGLVSQQGTISVNGQLQTVYPNLFVGGTALGQQGIDAIAPQEITLTLKNALLLPRFSLAPRLLPWTIRLTPEIAIVGVAEAEAKAWYGPNAWILQTPLFENFRAQTQGQPVGFCKLIVHQQGEILGAVLVAPHASALLQPVVQAMEQGLGVDAIAQGAHIPLSWANLVQQTAVQWRQRKRQPGQWQRDWQENWLNWRRQG